MQPVYRKNRDDFEISTRRNRHDSPHLHAFMECVYLLEGSLAIGQGLELYPMEKGDFAMIFPEVIHHYQLFSKEKSRGTYFFVFPEDAGSFGELLKQKAPGQPVIRASQVHPDIPYALSALQRSKGQPYRKGLASGYLQVILSRALPRLTLVEKSAVGSSDLVYQTVAYISGHFQEEVSLTKMAADLGISPYTLSRVFSSTFHMNFNSFLNETRLDYARSLLENTGLPVTEIAMEAGFSSLRTFNRFFLDRLRMSPRDYRKMFRGEFPVETPPALP